MNNIIQTIRHTARAAAVLLLALLAAQTAGAQTNVKDADDLALAFYDKTVSVVNVTNNITGVGDLSSINRALTIKLNGHTISGDGLHFNVDPYGSLTINGGGQDGSVGNIISGNAEQNAIYNRGTVTLSHVNIITYPDNAIWGTGTLNIGDKVSFKDISDIDNAYDLEEAYNDPTVGVINVTDNITGIGDLYLNRDLTINLNGHTISGDYLSFNVDTDGSLTINVGGQGGSVGNIISSNANVLAIDNDGTVTLRNVNITSNYDFAIRGYGMLNIGDNVSFNGWTDRPFSNPSVNIIEGGNYNYNPVNYNPRANVVATVTVGGVTHYFENSGAALTYIVSHPDNDHFSLSGTTYTIHTATGWDAFCALLEAGETFSGKTVELANDITVTRMAGLEGHEFQGTFDGNKKTLTVSISSSDGNAAPFREIMGATIRNLKVSGTVSGHKHSAGLVSYARGADSSVENTIENCLVATDVSTIVDTDGDCYLGGIVGHGFKSKLTIRGCAFTGSLTSPHNYTGGLQGWSDGNTLVLENDLFAASSVNAANVGFHPIAFHVNNATTTATVSNVYYTIAPTCTTASRIAAAGKQARAVTAGTDVTVAHAGVATHYATSGITAYKATGASADSDPFIAGLLYNNNVVDVLYAGSDEVVSLTLSNTAPGDVPDGYQYGYTTNAGTLSGTGNPYTLTMPNQDVTVSVNTEVLVAIDWATVNQGTGTDPYMIYNKDQLLLLAHRVNGTSDETAVEDGYYGKYFKLGADITFDPDDLTLDEGQSNYEAIGGRVGSTYRYFKGEFDGANHTVSGIRIRKDGSGNADINQGLFGCIASGANIYDVHLTDARITGYYSVGGIAGYNNEGYISGCSVTDSYITAHTCYGTICGENYGTLRNNYYHGCTVNGTAVTSGMGCQEADIAANHGALPAYRLDLGANITTPPGTFAGQTGWLDTPPVSPRLAPENGFTLAGNHYFASGYEFTPGSTLASGAAQGYTPRATLGDVLLDLYTPTGDDDPLAGKAIARLTITADCDGKTLKAALRSDGLQHDVSYMTADGTPGEASAIALDGTETSLAAGWYFVGTDIAFDHTLELSGDVHLILADGCTMNVTSDVYNYGINVDGSLTIYGQTEGTGALNATSENDEGIHSESGNITISGGRVTATSENADGIHSESGNITISGGRVTASGGGNGIFTYGGTITISGGRVTATGGFGISNYGGTITLGCTTASDFIYISRYVVVSEDGTLNIADGQTLFDEDGNYYSGNGVTIPAGKTLRPGLAARQAPDGNYWTTYYNGTTGFTIDKNENACAYTATYGAGQLTLHKLGKEIPAGTAVIIVADNSVVSMAATTLPAYSGPTNNLRGVDDDTPTSDLGTGTFYVLGMTTVNNVKHFGFHRYTGSDMAAHKAFVLVSGSQALARSLTMVFDEASGIGDATRLNNKEEIKNNNWFTLDGRRLQAKPTAPGIYVNNGNKVIIK